jgi:small subunit ribosomal protein S16
MGKKKVPFYRVVIQDSRAPRGGKYIESLGIYNPLRKEETRIDLERASFWMKKGAKPTEPVVRLMKVLRKEERDEGVNCSDSEVTGGSARQGCSD